MAAQEEDPSIEEILASIRQIISDDEEEATPAQKAPEAPKKAEKKSEPVVAPEPEEDILDLNDMVDVDDEEDDFVIGADDIDDEEDAFPEPNFDVDDDEAEDVHAATEDDIDLELMDHIVADEEDFDVSEDNSEIISDRAAEEAVGALSKLAQNVALSNRSADVTLEDIVKELVRPMLRQWINENMSDIVEALVEKELEKLVRQARNK
ncbi:MAG: hypothetical protein CMH25_01370 [Micavibrio sp.]|nr:hypothetical protein [Micavibrio sp.]|tara:strand:+ start:275477 stop:276100 length:624 start_codon:yes stop_codon:yes gene_type:complete